MGSQTGYEPPALIEAGAFAAVTMGGLPYGDPEGHHSHTIHWR